MNSLQNQKLADSLSAAKAAASNHVVKSADLIRADRERLIKANYLVEVIRGWYILTIPEGAGTTTLWHSNYWNFISVYLTNRFGADGYCLTPESSLDLYSGQNHIPHQITVMTKKTSNQPVKLMLETSILLYKDEKSFPREFKSGLNINAFKKPEALARATPSYFKMSPLNTELAIKTLSSIPELSRFLLDENLQAAAGRISGALQKFGDHKSSKQIIDDMEGAGYTVKPVNPFEQKPYLDSIRIKSPYSGRLEALWNEMRSDVIKEFTNVPKVAVEKETLRIIKRLYKEDSYHSLSIEGYQVTEELIERIKTGTYSPETDDSDTRSALAAKGYLAAFEAVQESILKVIKDKELPSEVFYDDVQGWYRSLFSPTVAAGILKPADLAGYRDHPVYIRDSQHVPIPVHALTDSMETLYKLLSKEEHYGVAAVLGHFFFGFIHPYSDGNGRIARFLMNLILISGGYSWTVVRITKRDQYLDGLEEASTKRDIIPFTKFIISEMNYWKDFIDQRK